MTCAINVIFQYIKWTTSLWKYYTMLNWTDHFMKKCPFCEIFSNFTKYKKSVSISWNGHCFTKRSISRSGYDILIRINVYKTYNKKKRRNYQLFIHEMNITIISPRKKQNTAWIILPTIKELAKLHYNHFHAALINHSNPLINLSSYTGI